MKDRNALIIIAKYPEKDRVKTRLKGLIPDNKRIDLYITLLNRTVNNLKTITGVDTFIAYAPESAREYFSRFKVELIPLHEGDLGMKMLEAFQEVFNSGYSKASLVGVDIPDLSSSIILRSFDILNYNDLVFGPARDGGYYLVGMNRLIKEIFENVPWSSEYTLRESIDRAKQSGYSIGYTEALRDIDTIKDAKEAGLL
jgi:hypothetical protein